MAEKLIIQQNELDHEIIKINQDFDRLSQVDSLDNTDKVSDNFNNLNMRIKNSIYEGEVINRREKILKQTKLTDYSSIDTLMKSFNPYYKFWSYASHFEYKYPQIFEGAIAGIDRDQLTKDIMDTYNDLFKLEKNEFKVIPHMQTLCKKLKDSYGQLKPLLPVVNDLKNPGLKTRHWKGIIDILGLDTDVQQVTNLSFKFLQEKNIMAHKDEIRDISEIASKELGFERILNTIKNEWKSIKFETMTFRNTQYHILKNIDPIIDKLDEDIGKLSSIGSSPNIKFLEADINSMKNSMIKTQEVIDLWVKVQKQWQYLQPIFASDDIQRQMPKEYSKFENIDKIWFSIMSSTEKNPNVNEACSHQKILENFQQCFDTSELIIKNLNDYLNTKREAFPRFYFLPNEELLMILAQTREVQMIQKSSKNRTLCSLKKTSILLHK